MDSVASIAVDYRFLLGLDGELYGCSAGTPCASPLIATNLAAPHRVIVEGLDIEPSAFSTASSVNVLCRGVADDTLPMGAIAQSTPSATPTPGPSPLPPVTTLSLDVAVPMLRVGEFNGLLAPGAAMLDSPPSGVMGVAAVRAASGGLIAAASGSSILIFDPRTISFSSSSAALAGERFGGTATGFVDSGGSPAILFAGGESGSGVARSDIETLRQGAATTRRIPFVGGTKRAYQSAAYFPNHHEQGGSYPAIVLAGGCEDFDGPGTVTASYDFFYPVSPPNLSGCSAGSQSGGGGVCRPGTGVAMGDGGHCKGVFGRLASGSADSLFIGGGLEGQPSYTFSGSGYLFDPELQTFATSSSLIVPDGLPASVTLSSNVVGFFGGENGSSSSSQWGFATTAGSFRFVQGGGNMKSARSGLVATRLVDGRVLIVGGESAAHSGRNAEFFTPTVVTMTAGSFAFATRLGASCTTGAEAGCVALAAPRSLPTAVAIAGSRTWINGAVVVSGGGASSLPSEIFVPAYACQGQQAISVVGSTLIGDVDFCDRSRTGQALTDPSRPQPF